MPQRGIMPESDAAADRWSALHQRNITGSKGFGTITNSPMKCWCGTVTSRPPHVLALLALFGTLLALFLCFFLTKRWRSRILYLSSLSSAWITSPDESDGYWYRRCRYRRRVRRPLHADDRAWLRLRVHRHPDPGFSCALSPQSW